MSEERTRWPDYYAALDSLELTPDPLDAAWDAYLFRAIMVASGINPDDHPSMCPGDYLNAFCRAGDEIAPKNYHEVIKDGVLQVRLTDELVEWFIHYVKQIYNDHCEAIFWANVPG